MRKFPEFFLKTKFREIFLHYFRFNFPSSATDARSPAKILHGAPRTGTFLGIRPNNNERVIMELKEW
jgi:hypothetical protein